MKSHEAKLWIEDLARQVEDLVEAHEELMAEIRRKNKLLDEVIRPIVEDADHQDSWWRGDDDDDEDDDPMWEDV